MSGTAATALGVTQLSNVEKLLGHSVTLTLGDKETRTVSGRLWAYEPALGVVALECSPLKLDPVLSSAPAAAASVAQASQASRSGKTSSSSVGFRIVKVAEIKKIVFDQHTNPNGASAETAAGSPATNLTPIHPVSLKTAQMRETDAVRQSLARQARTGKDVSKLGQSIFDALSKTLPCRWHESHILVMDEVVIVSIFCENVSNALAGHIADEVVYPVTIVRSRL